MEAVAGHLRKRAMSCIARRGRNNKDDDREKIGLEQRSRRRRLHRANNLRDIRLVGHSYGGW
jgi:hypothetical protein